MGNKTICGNPWCKATFFYTGEVIPRECPKCHSFDTQTSGGVSWTTREYTEPRDDGKSHETFINIDGVKYNGQERPLLSLIKKFLGK